MSTTTDIFGTKEIPADRLNYAIGMNLDAEDLRTEQTYHRRQVQRVLSYLHGYGTVSGLRVVWEGALAPGDDPAFPDGREETLLIEPGLAVDPIGRLIEIPRAICIRLNRWYESQDADDLNQALESGTWNGVVADLFIRFVVCERGKTPAFAAGPFDALDAVTASRLHDGFEAELIPRPEDDPPLPQETLWSGLDPAMNEGERQAALREAIFDSWREGTANWTEAGPPRRPEHLANQSPTDLFLARLEIPATPPADPADPPERTAGADVTIHQDDRPLSIPTAALARLLGL